MGNFYTNISLRTDDLDLVVATLREQNRVAFVSAPKDGWVVVYDRALEQADRGEVGRLNRELSKICHGISVAVTDYDDDFLWLQVCKGGELIDEYNSAPEYFERPSSSPSGGEARIISTTLERPESETSVREILHTRQYHFAIERHRDLAKSLELPLWSVGFGYRYLDRGELPAALESDDILHIQ